MTDYPTRLTDAEHKHAEWLFAHERRRQREREREALKSSPIFSITASAASQISSYPSRTGRGHGRATG
jgi:hypothetical protein